MKYVLSWHESIKHGGNKAKEDVDRFLKKDGYRVIETPSNKFLKVLFTYIYFITNDDSLKYGILY